MPDKSGVAEQIISIPKGGGELKGLGEKFQPDLHNGPFGLGWSLSVPNVSRKTSKGIPQYFDTFENGEPVWNPQEDTFILSGAEDLVHVGNGFYRPRTEGLFARIQRVKSQDDQEPC